MIISDGYYTFDERRRLAQIARQDANALSSLEFFRTSTVLGFAVVSME